MCAPCHRPDVHRELDLSMLRKWHDDLVSPEEMRRISARQEDEYVVESILDHRGRIENWNRKRSPLFEVLVKWETYLLHTMVDPF